MDPKQASASAMATALIRAVHTRCDRPILVDDPYGDLLVTAAERAALRERFLLMLVEERQRDIRQIADGERSFDLAVRASPAYGAVVIRARYAEDRLHAAISQGVRQYVLVGAGLDSFGLRQGALAETLQVFEIDHPTTQASKRDRLARAGLEPPANLHFVAADLERDTIASALSESPFRPSEPAFFAWLGMTPFFSRDANLALLQAMAHAAAPASAVVFDYLDLDAFSADRAAEAIQRVRSERATSDEPWVSGFDPRLLPAQLRARGLTLVEDLGSAEADARYCAGRSDGLRMTPHVHLAWARIE